MFLWALSALFVVRVIVVPSEPPSWEDNSPEHFYLNRHPLFKFETNSGKKCDWAATFKKELLTMIVERLPGQKINKILSNYADARRVFLKSALLDSSGTQQAVMSSPRAYEL
jgi:hypothetical protein